MHICGACVHSGRCALQNSIVTMQTTIRAISGAYQQIDHAIAEALYHSKPVLIQVASNMASLTHPLFEKDPVPFSMTGKTTNQVYSCVCFGLA